MASKVTKLFIYFVLYWIVLNPDAFRVLFLFDHTVTLRLTWLRALWHPCCWQFCAGLPVPGLSRAVPVGAAGIPRLPGGVSCSQLGERAVLLQGLRTHGHLQCHDPEGNWPLTSTVAELAVNGDLMASVFADDSQRHPAIYFCLHRLPLWILSR